MKQEDLARNFALGYQSGQASNLHIQKEGDGTTLLVGYNWAVYARRKHNKILVFDEEWCEWAREQGGQATLQQFHRIRKGLRSTGLKWESDPLNRRPTVSEEPDSVQRIGSPPTR